MNRAACLGLALAVLATPGCVRNGEGGAAPAAPPPSTVTVQNNNWHDITVYALRNGAYHRLGMVTTTSAKRFVLPRTLADFGSVRLLVELIGSSSSWTTDNIRFMQGDGIRFVVQNHLALSSFRVAAR